MTVPILATKLFIPSLRSRSVTRPRLVERLTGGLQGGGKLTLVSAPAGFGKSTLLSEWIAALRADAGAPRFCWLSLDEADSEPVRFLAYLVAALQTVEPTLGETLQAGLRSPRPPAAETLLTGLVNEMAALQQPLVLVLDDYHRVDCRTVDDALAFLLDNLPPQMHLVVASREDPPLSLARLRARGHLIEVRAADLRFTPAEAVEFLNRVMELALSEEEVAVLERRTEGWIAGLQLAALALQAMLSQHEDADTAGFIDAFSGSHQFVLDYLLEEVFERQPRHLQDFLLCTSILDRLCAPLCDAVLGTVPPSAEEMLASLERANLFIVPLDAERRWFRYHHLFGDLLRRRLGRPPEFCTHHLRASLWYEADGDMAEAFSHALAAEDFDRAARVAEAGWQDMDHSFQTTAWLGWVSRLPDGVVRSRPGLCFQLGSAYSDAGDAATSETHLRNAEHALARSTERSEELKSLPGSIALARAYNSQMQGDAESMVRFAELALALIPEDDLFGRAQAAVTLGFTHWSAGDLEAYLRAMRAWVDGMRTMGNDVFAIASGFAVADALVALGRLSEAEGALRQAIQEAAALGRDALPVTAHHHLGLALLAHERGDDTEAAQRLQTAAELGRRSTLVDWPHRWQLAQARLRESAGDWHGALEALDEAARAYTKNPVPAARPIEALKARVHLKQGRLDKAQAWARGISTEDEVGYLAEYEHLTLVRARVAEGSLDGMGDLLQRLLAHAEAQRRAASVIEILMTQALAHQAEGDPAQAIAALERALTLAEPEGYLRVFVDEGEPMRSLLQALGSAMAERVRPGTHPVLGYVSRLLAAFPPSAETNPRSRIAPQRFGMVDPLSDRELEILGLIARGLSNAEIGRRLYLALSTVKGHNLRIFGKLHVQNRTEAVARARELGLL
jgi:LuxR family transcriptional regulator, maltose regulon positive regulatory protein